MDVMICDTPEAYEGQPGFEFLKAVPTTWDQTVVPNASVNEYVTIARKKGEDWFVGTINNSQARSIFFESLGVENRKRGLVRTWCRNSSAVQSLVTLQRPLPVTKIF